MLEGITNGSPVSVAEFPVAWKIAIVEDPQYANFQYVRYGSIPGPRSTVPLTLRFKHLLGVDKYGMGSCGVWQHPRWNEGEELH